MRRRHFLASLGIGAGLTALPSFARRGFLGARAQADASIPSRFVVFHTPNCPWGPEHWTPAGSGDRAIASLPEMLSPLSRHASRLLMIGGVDLPHPAQNHSAIARCLTARAVGNAIGHEDAAHDLWGKGASLDHAIAAHLGVEAMVLGVRTGARDPLNRLSYVGADQPVDPIDDPRVAFTHAFGPILESAEAQAALRASYARSGSILEASREQMELLRPRVGRSDREKLDAHLDVLASVEARFARDAAGLSACTPSALAIPAGFDPTAPDFATRTARLQMDVLSRALSCNVTRVATLQVGTSGDTFGSHVSAPELGIDLGAGVSEHNRIVHVPDADWTADERSRRDARRMQLEQLYFGLFADLLDRLDAIPEGDGTLLDHTTVLWVKSLATQEHRAEPLLAMLAGGSALGLSTGRFLDRSGQPINALHASVGNLFGMGLESFGDLAWGGSDEYWVPPEWSAMGPMDLG